MEKKNEETINIVEEKDKNIKRERISGGVAFLSIVFIAFGVQQLVVMSFFWGILYLFSGLGLLFQKFWGLKLAQISISINMISSFFIFILPEMSIMLKIISFLIYNIINIAILFYLLRLKTLKQFVEILDDEFPLKKTEMINSSLTIIMMVIGYGGQFLLFIMMVSYFFEWFGNWAYLLVIGGLIGLPFVSFLLYFLTLAPVFPIFFWIYTGIFPLWFFIIWGISFVSLIGFPYFIYKRCE
jgi:hypothetical protein